MGPSYPPCKQGSGACGGLVQLPHEFASFPVCSASLDTSRIAVALSPPRPGCSSGLSQRRWPYGHGLLWSPGRFAACTLRTTVVLSAVLFLCTSSCEGSDYSGGAASVSTVSSWLSSFRQFRLVGDDRPAASSADHQEATDQFVEGPSPRADAASVAFPNLPLFVNDLPRPLSPPEDASLTPDVSSPGTEASSGHKVESRYGSASVDHAVFVVPGIAGSGMFATVVNAVVKACGSAPLNYPSPFRVWASLTLILPPPSHQRCWIEMMKMHVDGRGENYTSVDGVKVEVDGYGGIHAIDYLDYYMNNTYGVPASAYMHVMLRTLLSLHYAQFVTLRGVPYDWRLPPWQLNYDLLKKDIEDRYEELHQRKVELISHSLGGIVLCYFLNKVVDQEWKDKYIGSFTLVAPATGGSFKAIKSLLSGYNDAADFDIWNVMDISLFPAILLRDLLQTMGSIYALLPDPAIYGTERVIVRVARPSKTGDRTFVPSSAGVNIEELSPQEGLTADEMRRRLEAIDGTPMGDVKSEKEHGTTVPDLIGESRKEKLSGSAADGEPDLYVYKLSETFGFGSENDRAGLTDSATEEDREKEAEERRQAVLREIEELNRVPHEERAARQRARHKQHVEREQKRLQEALRLAESQGLEEDVYTLSNWTSLLPANLQQRVLTAREKMAGVVADPGVPVRCIWSKFSYPTTDVAYYYPWGNLDRHPIPIFDYGDDTVPLPSLSLCASWPSTVKTTVLDNLDHMYIFADRGFNKIIYNMFSPVPAAGAQPTVLYPSEAKSF